MIQALISLDGDPNDDENDVNSSEDADLTLPTENAGDDRLEEGDSSFDISTHTVGGNNGPASGSRAGPVAENLRFSVLLSTVLQDAQTRLVFRAQSVLEAEVLHYAPKPEDLEYPEKLRIAKTAEENRGEGEKGQEKGKQREQGQRQGMERKAEAEADSEAMMGVVEEDGMAVFKLPHESVMQDWYPTLKRTLWVLSRLHSYVNVSLHLRQNYGESN